MADRDRWGDAAIDDYLPNIATMSTQYSVPSTRANSESSLNRSRDRVDFVPLKPAISGYGSNKMLSTQGAKYATRNDKVGMIKQTNGTSGQLLIRDRNTRV